MRHSACESKRLYICQFNCSNIGKDILVGDIIIFQEVNTKLDIHSLLLFCSLADVKKNIYIYIYFK